MSDAKTLEELSTTTYWDARYTKAASAPSSRDSTNSGTANTIDTDGTTTTTAAAENPTTFEWFFPYARLAPFLSAHLPPPSHAGTILHLGIGNSTLALDLATCPSLPYPSHLCLDFSRVVIAQMRSAYSATYPQIRWLEQDVRDMRDVPSESVTVAIDKGTMDAMISGSPWDPPESVRRNVRMYVDEVARVLKGGGVWVYVTWRQPHFVKPALEREGVWRVSSEVIGEEGGGGGFDYFGYVMRKVGGGEAEAEAEGT